MHRLLCGTYSKPVRGENEDGCQSLAPGADGQMSRTTRFTPVFLSSTGISFPLLRSTPLLDVMWAKGLADRISPEVRSTTYMYPLRSGWTRTLRLVPFMSRSSSTFSL